MEPKAVDFVCGREVFIRNPAAKSEFEGQAYYFCSENCEARFNRDPGLFIGKKEILKEKGTESAIVL